MAYSVADVVGILDVPRSSIHRWSKQYGEFLSDDATPGRGKARSYTDQDLKVLSFIKARSGEGLTVAVIQKELPKAQLPELAAVLSRPRQSRDLVGADEALVKGLAQVVATNQATQDSLATAVDRIADTMDVWAVVQTLQVQLASLQQEVADLRKKTHRHKDNFPYRAVYETHQEEN